MSEKLEFNPNETVQEREFAVKREKERSKHMWTRVYIL